MRALFALFLLAALPSLAVAQPTQGPYGPGPCPFGASSCTVTPTGGTVSMTLAAWMQLVMSGVTSTYTTSGAIALTDALSVANCASACTLTVADASTALRQINIHNIGVAPATISFTHIEGVANTVAMAAAPSGANLLVRWIPSLTTWIVLSLN